MPSSWLSSSPSQLGLVALSTLAVYAAVITYTRVAGLRSFSKMSSFDFASTVAVGSIMATVAVTDASLLNGLAGLAVLYAAQVALAVARRRTRVQELVDNQPLVLMARGELLEDNLRRARITSNDMWARLREADVTDTAEVLGVVLETTGDISVLTGPGPLDARLCDGVLGAERLR